MNQLLVSAWTESMELISSFQQPAPIHFWTVLVDLAEVAALSGEYEAALRYTGQLVQKYDQQGNNAMRAADARYCYAVFARLKGDLNSAYRSISSAVNLISQQNPTSPSSVDKFIGLRVQAELARVQGDYAASQAAVDLAASIVLDCGMRFMLADVLFDQACFTHQQEMFAETKLLIERVMHVAQQEDLPAFHQRGLDMLQQLPETGSR